MNKESIVLDKNQINQKTMRIAYQIVENSFEENQLFVAGIAGNGFLFAEKLVLILNEITDQEIKLFEIKVLKDAPMDDEIKLSIDENDLTDSTVILVDDVINSGRTMIYAVRRLLENNLMQLKVATLVNRTHRRYPVHADFVGLNISTTLQDNITVEFGENEMAYLN